MHKVLVSSRAWEHHTDAPLQIYKLLTLVSWKTFGFWNVVSFVTDCLLTAAFVLRIAGIAATGDEATILRVRSFQCLSLAAPLLW